MYGDRLELVGFCILALGIAWAVMLLVGVAVEPIGVVGELIAE